MKFLVSTTQSRLRNQFGQWYWQADSRCKTMSRGGQLIIYSGYTISAPIEELLEKDPHLVQAEDGAFFVVILTRDTATAYVDFFTHEKLLFSTRHGIEITNRPWLLTLNGEDIDREEVESRIHTPLAGRDYNPQTGYEDFYRYLDWQPLFDWRSKPDRYEEEGGLRHFGKKINCTVFHDVWQLQPDHFIQVNRDKLAEVRHSNSLQMIKDAVLQEEVEFHTQEELAQHVHDCMSTHANVIRENFKDILVSTSEGIDSCLQDMYLPECHRAMYTLHPLNSPMEYKTQAVLRNKRQDCHMSFFNCYKENIQDAARTYMRDFSIYYIDCVPTMKQMHNLPHKPDVVVFGQGGDQTFMHRPNFLWEYWLIEGAKRHESFDEQINFFHGKMQELNKGYSARWNIWQEPYTKWQDVFTDYNEDQMRETMQLAKKRPREYWAEEVAKYAAPAHYNRDIGCNADLLFTSLYSDKRFWLSVYKSSKEVMESNLHNAETQRFMLEKYFNYTDFKTPSKDGEEYHIQHILQPFYSSALKYSIQDHLHQLDE